jgi:hypothetical protein
MKSYCFATPSRRIKVDATPQEFPALEVQLMDDEMAIVVTYLSGEDDDGIGVVIRRDVNGAVVCVQMDRVDVG